MGGIPTLAGSLAVWQGLFSTAELDGLVRLGDGLALEAAELSSGRGYENIRKARVSWVRRAPDS